MHPSGRSTQRTSRASMTDVDVLGAAERPRERRQPGCAAAIASSTPSAILCAIRLFDTLLSV
jgi:hypothetical protein